MNYREIKPVKIIGKTLAIFESGVTELPKEQTEPSEEKED